MVNRIMIVGIMSCFLLISVPGYLMAKETTQVETLPDWVRNNKPIKDSAIPETEYPYLAKWLEEHTKPAHQYVIDLFSRHQIVVLGESHNIKEHKEFVIKLIPQLYHEAGVRCIGWEFSRYTDNSKLEKLVNFTEYNEEAALQFARDQFAHEWNSKEHWDIIKAVWQLNQSLKPGQEKMRLIGLDKDVDYCRFFLVSKTKSPDSSEFKEILSEILKRDKTMAEHIEEEIITQGKKGLIFVGRCHDFTHYKFSPTINLGRDIMGNLLHNKFGDCIFQVWLGPGPGSLIENVMKLRGHNLVGFDLYQSPFANILTPVDWSDAPEVPFANVARGYVYLGPQANLNRNTSIKGFVTKEMFKKYKQYYEIDFERTFKDAEELDHYLQSHRFPKP
jgi:uncharacterized iron-regulated protein